MELECWPDKRWVVRFPDGVDLVRPGETERLSQILEGGCRHLLIDLSQVDQLSLLEADFLYSLKIAASFWGATTEIVNPAPRVQQLLVALYGKSLQQR